MKAENANVFVLTVDSLRADAFQDIAAEVADRVGGVHFTEAIATASGTAHSMPALAAGVYGDESGYGLSEAGEDDIVTVAECLHEYDFTNYLWSENPLFSPKANYDRGFEAEGGGTPWQKELQNIIQKIPSEQFWKFSKWGYFTVIKPLLSSVGADDNYYSPASTFHEDVLSTLEGTAKSMFWLHYMDVHHPFEPPQDFLSQREFSTNYTQSELANLSSSLIISNGDGYTDDEIEDVRQAYLACCDWFRDELFRFLDELKNRGYYRPDRDVFILTADHGESFSLEKHDMLGHTPTPAFWEELIRVPLVVNLPDWGSKTVEGQVSHIDIAPTLLSHLGVPVPDSYSGTAAELPEDMVTDSAFIRASSIGGDYAGIRQDGWKLFGDRVEPEDGVELYSQEYRQRVLLTQYDETDTIEYESPFPHIQPPSNSGLNYRWRELHDDLKEECGGPITDGSEEELDEDVQDRLRDLGYIDDVKSV